MKKKPDPRASLDARAAEVLTGKRQVSASELAALVREANPTTRSLDRSQRDARYGLKAQLQSFLLTQFEDEVRVALAPELGEGMVVLNLSNGGASAGHVPLLELDVDALSIARRKLDTPPDSDRGRIAPRHASQDTPPEPPPTHSPLLLGQQALDAYDFEEAQRCFEHALRLGDPAAPEALLGLLVDTLGLDHDALALGSRLDGKTRRLAGVRRRLGTAAARLGLLDQAARELEGFFERDDAPALASLARAWLTRGAPDAASSWLEAARRADPTEPTLAELTQALHKHREAARHAEEQALQALVDAGAEAQAAEAARALLARFADSPLARRIASEAEQRERRQALASLRAEIDALRAQGALGAAAELARRAASLADAHERDAWLSQAHTLEAGAHDKLAHEQVQRVLALRARDERTFLLALAALPPETRARMRDAVPDDPLVTWLLQALRPGASRREQAVDAVLALHRAHGLLDPAPESCRSLLDHHAPALDGIAAATTLRAAAQQRLDAHAHEAALQALHRASEALEQERPAEALACLETPGLRLLAPADADRARALREQALVLEAQQRHAAALQEHLERGDLFGALRTLDRILETHAPSPRWRSEQASLRQRLLTSLRWGCTEAAGSAEVQLPPPSLASSIPVPLVTPDGQHLILPTSYGRWVFVRVVSMRTGQVEKRVRLCAPAPFGFVETMVLASEVVLFGEHGSVLRLSLQDWTPLDFWDVSTLQRPGERINQLDCARDGRFAWLLLEQRAGAEERSLLVDLHRRSVVRSFKKSRLVDALPGDSPRMAAFSLERTISLHDPRGASLAPQISVEGQPISLLATDEGDYLAASNREGESDSTLVLTLLSAEGSVRASTLIEGADADRISQIGLADGRLFLRILSPDDEDAHELIEIDPRTLRELCRHKNLHPLCMVSDHTGRHPALIHGSGGSLQLQPLQANLVPPPAPVGCPYEHGLFPSLHAASPSHREALQLERELRSLSPSAREGWIEAARARKNDDPALLEPLIEALGWAGLTEQADRLLEQACALHPGDPYLEHRCALRLLSQRRVPEAAEHLRKVDLHRLQPTHDTPEDPHAEAGWLSGRLSRDLALLEAVVALYAGDLPAAHRALAIVLDKPDLYYPTLAGWLRATAPEPSPEEDRDGWLLRLLDVLGQADQALDAGDPRAALRALGSRWTFVAGEEQLLARHWQAWQQAGPLGPDEHFFATEAAAAFAHAMAEAATELHPPLPGRTWPDAKLQALLAQAQAWLHEPPMPSSPASPPEPQRAAR